MSNMDKKSGLMQNICKTASKKKGCVCMSNRKITC